MEESATWCYCDQKLQYRSIISTAEYGFLSYGDIEPPHIAMYGGIAAIFAIVIAADGTYIGGS